MRTSVFYRYNIMRYNHVYAFLTALKTLLICGFLIIIILPVAECNSNSNVNGCLSDFSEDLKLSMPEECARPCVEGEPPKVCYFKFTLELYTVLGGACSLCTPNETNWITPNCQCVTADGVERGILTVNRMLPGPSIHVCKGDKVVIDLKNSMVGMETSIHWHGVFQKGSQYYDGVPMLTQCPILYGTTFRYQFHADNEGTHFYHAHDGPQKLDGIHGKFIIRTPPSEDPNSNLYDFDLTEHEILLADWMHDHSINHYPGLLKSNIGQVPVSALINGKGRYTDPTTNQTTDTPLAEFTVRQNYKYRMRIINSFCSTCPAELVFEGHTLTLIAVDGVPVQPTKINTIVSFAGERFDVVLEAVQPPRNYWIHLRALGGCNAFKAQQFAILRYSTDDHLQTSSEQPTYDSSLPKGITLSPLDGICNVTRRDAVCFNQLTSARPVDKRILKGQSDFQFYLPAGFFYFTNEQLFKPDTYNHFAIPASLRTFAALIDNITHVPTASPLLSQIHDIPQESFCNANDLPKNCSSPCSCTHKIDIPLNSVVELILTDGLGVPNLFHPFHLHGYAFNVISMGKAPYKNVTRMNASHARRMEHEGLFRRRFNKPPFKDTVPIPTGGYVILRFRADNPGYWLFHCHFVFHHLAGMELIFHVGEDKKDLPPVPKNFPTCGNHLPPIIRDQY